MVTRHRGVPAGLLAALWLIALFFVWPGGKVEASDTHGSPDFPCARCHAEHDPHAGTAKAGCDSCHTAKGWKPPTFDVARHASTAFALHGKHTEVACAQCHTKAKLTGLPGECAGCHVDVHRGKLGSECQSCHSADGFAPVPGFDHARTGFVLAGKHASADCASCHEGEHGKALRTSGAACTTCHTPEHGTFTVAAGVSPATCETCHTPDETFADARAGFDHRATGFPLERRHGVVACASCHEAEEAAPVARCSSCHLDPHAGQLGQQCEDCHRPDRWRLARFDHDTTGWALRGRHFVTPCASCHTSQRWVGLTTECWDCHAADATRAPQSVEAHKFGRTTCGDCHGTWSWDF
jgi:hypothetical protein